MPATGTIFLEIANKNLTFKITYDIIFIEKEKRSEFMGLDFTISLKFK